MKASIHNVLFLILCAKLEYKRALNRARCRRWNEKNPGRRKEIANLSARKHGVKRRKASAILSLRHRLSCRIRTALKQGIKKACRTTELLGCSIEQLRQYLEKQFKPGMTWENHGKNGWHIDHIRPCASFDLTNAEQQKQCFNYRNLQPLWANENWKKNDYYEG